MNARVATRYIAPPEGWQKVMHENGNVQDIIEVILKADRLSPKYTQQLAQQLRQDDEYETLRAVWRFVKEHVKYVLDKDGKQVIQLPGRLWQSRQGDCKSISVFQGSVLKTLNFKYLYRFTFYDKNFPQCGYCYVVAQCNGKEVILDTLQDFDTEKPYWKCIDKQP